MTVLFIMYLAMSGLGDAVEDLRAATCRFGRELFLPVGPVNYTSCKANRPGQMQAINFNPN